MKKGRITILLLALMIGINSSYARIEGKEEILLGELGNEALKNEENMKRTEFPNTVQIEEITAAEKTDNFSSEEISRINTFKSREKAKNGNRSYEAKSGVYSGKCGENAEWHFDTSTGTLTISGKGAVKREEAWYSFSKQVKKLVVKNGITSIKSWSFYYYYPNLVRVELPASVKKIADWTFSGCTSLSELILPDGITEIGAEAFSECKSLQAIKIPSKVVRIGNCAFRDCDSLEDVRLPKNLKEAGYAVFEGCKKLKSISIPGKLKMIDMRTFENCTSLNQVMIENGVEVINLNAFSGCASLKNIVIPASISLVQGAFLECSRLESISFLGKTTRIGERTFQNPRNLIMSGYSGSEAERYAKLHKVTFRNLEKHIHQWENAGVKTKPTCTKTGINYMRCAVCAEQKEVTVNKLGHKYVDGKCSRCGSLQEIALRTCSVSLPTFKYTYTGAEIKPTVIVKNGSGVLKNGRDYTVTYRDNRSVGGAYAVVTGKGRYTGSKTIRFTIRPKKSSFTKVKSDDSGYMQLAWQKVSGVSGYQIRLRTSSGSGIRTRFEAEKTKTVLTGVTRGRIYWISIRAYQTVDGQRYYSEWSSERTVQIKK